MNSKHRREVTIEVLVGLFMFIVLIALGIFTIVLSRDNFLSKDYPYEFVFSEINGLREGDNVFLRGMNIGRVKQTQLENSRVHVFVSLDVPVKLRHGYQIDVVGSSMLGGKILKIYEGPEDAQELGENVTIIGAKPIDVLEEIGSTIHGLQEIIDDIGQGKGTLGKLLKDETMYNNLLVLSKDLKHIGERIERGEGTIGKLLKEDDIYEDAHVMIANLRGMSDRLAAGEGTLGKLMSEDDKLYEDVAAMMAAARSIAETIDNGEGTLGKLVRDAKLYDETTLLVEDVRAAVDDLREASPITSFGSVMFGAF